MNLACYIVDDERPAIDILTEYISMTPGLTLCGSSPDPLHALNEINLVRPDLVFLDIDMPKINGLEFAGLVNTFTTIVFTTSYRDYAPEAFEKEAAGYLLKPIPYERFLSCVQRIRKNTGLGISARQSKKASFFVKSGERGNLVKINIPAISYIASSLNYVDIHLDGHKVLAYMAITEILEELPADTFIRIHKSYVVNLDHVQAVAYSHVKLRDQTLLPVGRAFRNDFREKIRPEILVSKWDQAE